MMKLLIVEERDLISSSFYSSINFEETNFTFFNFSGANFDHENDSRQITIIQTIIPLLISAVSFFYILK